MEPEEPYPVMVYFYGGAYTFGSNLQYPGHFYAARDVVIVVPNYRVGIFGEHFDFLFFFYLLLLFLIYKMKIIVLH